MAHQFQHIAPRPRANRLLHRGARHFEAHRRTAIEHKVVRQTTLQTTTSTTYVDVPGAKIPVAELTIGKKYLLVVTGLWSHSSTSTRWRSSAG